ncbi:hypothetical protein Ahy_B07g086768 [Arachis hypogaea]|uniref:Uncharacterized protein n=1 Tax=Arachis hypogaea TaxID=3818 RepID=A0A444YAF1_ARAHY|nr:hypothetical protein Ahy_B07g086768 [Arachis hypogaea]
MMPPLATDATTPKSSHGNKPADAPPPPPIVRLTIWLDGKMVTRSTISSSGRYKTIVWVGDCNRCWRMYVRGATTLLLGSTRKSRRLYTFIGRPMRGSSIGVSQTELTAVSARLSKYTSSSATFMKTKLKSLDHDAILAETFNYTYTLKENKERFAGQRSADYYRLEATTQQSQQSGKDASGSTASIVDPDAV